MFTPHSERSPLRIFTVGTVKVDASGWMSLRRSIANMKNVRSRRIGPESVAV